MTPILEINFDSIKYNIKQIREKIHNPNVTMIAMIKANAYGMGDVEIAKFLEKENIHFLGTASLEEAIHLREHGITSDILVTCPIQEQDVDLAVNYNFHYSCTDQTILEKLNKKGRPVNVHLAINTGMNRLGEMDTKVIYLADYITHQLPNIQLQGIYSHLSCADSDFDFTQKQIEYFETTINKLKSYHIPYIHLLNSSGLINFSNYTYTAVRIGDILYGYYPDESLRSRIHLLPCASLKAPIISIRDIHQGDYVSYNNHFQSVKDMKVATIQIGYADGLDRGLSNGTISDHLSILGSVCMDMCMVDITGKNYTVGDYVTVFNNDQDIYHIGKQLNTINYEILSRIGNRVKRRYINVPQ